ncbi:uncharacterized protein MEPE_02680 [Melanopsichium pennsylvanicum]|uniref:Uncharacterized protein n=1 Tax=Melanopsichium pennsylvanicum TaxID=63383 RepID=A0AAJ5C4S5_9BASI|nr:uncharacterized protein MEPE_02680 [Melanopsichium pennsylvanicum]
MITAIRSSPVIKAKERIVSWILFVFHALVLSLSILLLLSPNTIFNRQNGLASVKLNLGALIPSSLNGSTLSSNITAANA